MTYDEIADAVAPLGLMIMGAFEQGQTGNVETHMLIGADAGFWDVFCASPERNDGAPDPIDRWSKRTIGEIAIQAGTTISFPSDGPPYAPFIRWALETGRFWQSPTGMLVHDTAGLMISIRAALHFGTPLRLPQVQAETPCSTCTDHPCITACPVGALSGDAPYDVPACKTFLDTIDGQDCMTQGCKARRACPVSSAFGRDPDQSAFHMAAFKG